MQILENINLRVAAQFTRLLEAVGNALTAGRFAALEQGLERAGSVTAPVTAVLLLTAGIIGAIKLDSFLVFGGSVAAAVAFFAAHWSGRELMRNCDAAVANSTCRVSGYGIFRTVALLLLITLIGLVIFGVYMSIKVSRVEPLYAPLGFAIAICFAVWFLLNPGLLGIREDGVSGAGEDALTICVFSLAGLTRLHRVVFGLGLVLGTLEIAHGLFRVMSQGVEVVLGGGLMGYAGMIGVFAAALAPLALYLAHVFSYLVVDLLRAILRIGR